MRSDDRVRLKHMLDASRKAVAFVRNKSRQDLETDELLSLAVVRLLEIVGEAARAVSQDLRDDHPDVPWKQIAGTRDRLVHGYFNVDMDVVWSIVTGDLPDLIASLEDIVG